MRYLPLTDADRSEMLSVIGVRSVDELFRDVPEAARLKEKIAGLGDHMGELEVDRALSAMAAKSRAASAGPFFVGAGAYKHHVPSSVDHLIQRGEFLTSYTPYQPEITQGTLQYLFEFQTQIALLTGMDVANASMYDASTGAAEAVLMANRVTRRTKAILSGGLHPHYRSIIQTTAHWEGYQAAIGKADVDGLEDLIAGIDSLADQAARHLPHELVARGEEADIRPAEVQADAKRLAFRHDDVSPHVARRRQQAERHDLGDDDDQ